MEYMNTGYITAIGGKKCKDTYRNNAFKDLNSEREEFKDSQLKNTDLDYYVKYKSNGVTRQIMEKALEVATTDLDLGEVQLFECRPETVEEATKRILLNDFDDRVLLDSNCRGVVRRDHSGIMYIFPDNHSSKKDLIDTVFHESWHLKQYQKMPFLTEFKDGIPPFVDKESKSMLESQASEYTKIMMKKLFP